MASATMQVQAPLGSQPGQIVRATTPEGLIIEAVIPSGVRPGSTFRVQYPGGDQAVQEAATSKPSDCDEAGKGVIGLIVLIMLAVVVTNMMKVVFSSGVMTIMFIGVSLVVAHDWSTLGPTLAIQHGAHAGVWAWILVLPIKVVFGSVSTWFLVTMSLAYWCAVSAALGPTGCVLGAVVFSLVMCAVKFFNELLEGHIGYLVIYAITFSVLRSLAMLATAAQQIETWPNLTQVLRSSPEFQQQCDFFLASSMPWGHKFDFSLNVRRIFRVHRPGSEVPAGGAGVRQLFHGTQWESAKGIICDGFRLPNKGGMFGKGLYFADCPLKCWRYCFPSKQAGQLSQAAGRGGLILMCWVELGEMREEKRAKTDLEGYNRSSLWSLLTGGRGAYDSVKAVEMEQGGAVRVPEYVVYRPEQAHLAYLFEVDFAPQVVPLE